MTRSLADLPREGRLSENLIWFARALRKAGLPVGPGTALLALRAVEAAGFERREDFYVTLQAVFVTRADQRAVFDQMFRLFWRDPRFMEHMMALMLPSMRGTHSESPAAAAARRAAEALTESAALPDLPPPPEGEEEITIDASGTLSGVEHLRELDFEQMSREEAARAARIIAGLRLRVDPILSRRRKAALRGPFIDPRRTLSQAIRQGGELSRLPRRRQKPEWPRLVILCDISGSMSDYSRMVLHFAHSLANRPGEGWSKVHALTFGTRLTDISRHLRGADVDAALRAAGRAARDWQGGSRIGECLTLLSKGRYRHLLGRRAVVLLITDGLDRGAPEDLAAATERLRRNCRRLIWLNPLLRWDGFAPKARGIAAMLPHVDSLRAAHSIASFEALADAISDPRDHGEKARLMAMMAA